MPTIPSTSITHVEVQMLGTISAAGSNSKNVANVYNFRRTANVLPLSKANINTAFQAAIGAPVIAALQARYSQTFNTVRFIDDATDVPSGFAQAGVGAIATDSYATYGAVCVNLKTSYRGGSGRGSKHFTPFAEADTTGDVLTGAGLARWQTVEAALLAGFTDADGNVWVPEIVIRHPVDPTKPRSQLSVNPTTVLSNDVISSILDVTVGTMRRRKTKTVV